LQTIIEAGTSMGINRAVLEVRASNTAALALYESLGFKPAGKRRDYYSEPDEDALIYVYEWS
jgi:ribosomal-protein-alanine N-acetyltransferase